MKWVKECHIATASDKNFRHAIAHFLQRGSTPEKLLENPLDVTYYAIYHAVWQALPEPVAAG